MTTTLDPYAELTAYQNSAVLMAAAEVGLFDALTTQPQPLADLAAKCRLPLAPARSLLVALAACGYVARHAMPDGSSGYGHNEVSEAFVSDGAFGLRRVAHKEAYFYRAWAHLAGALENGQSVLDRFAVRLAADPAQARLFLTALNDLAATAWAGLQPHLQLDGRMRLLDAGGGGGGYARLLAETYPKLGVTLLDWPEVLEIARETVGASRAAARVALRAGDLRLPGAGIEPAAEPFDAVFLSHVLHDYAPDMAAAIVSNVAGLLAPKGVGYILDVPAPGEDEAHSAIEALFDLMMLVENPGGRTHPLKDLEAWLTAAGMRVTATHKLYFGMLIEFSPSRS